MGKFYHTISSPPTSNATGSNNSEVNIELNGDILGYGPPSEVLTSIAPTGVLAGTYSSVRVNDKGQVVEGFKTDIGMQLAIKSFYFVSPAMRWRVTHNMNTVNFTESIKNNQGAKMYANISIVDGNEFLVELTEPESGSIVVTFDLANSSN
jgi:hypothetical protein